MKNLITTIASMIIIMTFLCQIITNERTFIRVYSSDAIINSHLENWSEVGEVKKHDEIVLANDMEKATAGKVKVMSVTPSKGNEGVYDICLKYEDVIGPYEIIGYKGENAALRTRKVYVEALKEEETEEPETDNPEEKSKTKESTKEESKNGGEQDE